MWHRTTSISRSERRWARRRRRFPTAACGGTTRHRRCSCPNGLRPRRSPAPRTRQWPTGGAGQCAWAASRSAEIRLPHSWSTRTCRLTPRSPSSRRSASGASSRRGARGWSLRDAWDVSATPEQYRAYIQRSRGEFSCAKPTYVKLATGWVSDRTACYLASGKPAVVQHTGPSRFLPDADGLFRFRNMDEAARALAQVESDYERHCRLARALAEEYFDARRVVGRMLEQALAERVGHPA